MSSEGSSFSTVDIKWRGKTYDSCTIIFPEEITAGQDWTLTVIERTLEYSWCEIVYRSDALPVT